MKTKTFKSNVLISLIAVLFLFIASALFVNFTLRNMVDNLVDEAKPDERLVNLKAVMVDLSNAESNVKSYGLTNNENYLAEYNSSVDAVNNGIDSLYKKAEEDSVYFREIERADHLIQEKFNILDELLIVQNQQSIDAVFDKVEDAVSDLGSVNRKKSISSAETKAAKEEEKKGFFKRIFGNRKKENADDDNSQNSSSDDYTADYLDNYKRVELELDQLKVEENQAEENLKQQELNLIKADKQIMEKLNGVFARLETLEQKSMEQEIAAADKEGSFTGILITVFCIISSILLLAAGYIIYNYYVKNEAYKKALKIAKEETESKNNDIMASINYAKRIQTAILPDQHKIKQHLPQSFIIYKPKDIVAGDFYWLVHIDNYTFVAVADCTGHGVPGAMVSMTCSSALNRSIKEFGLRKPSEILNKTRDLVIETFDQNNVSVEDGMDIALCRIDRKNKCIQYAGAHNSLYVINNGDFNEIKADKLSVSKNSQSSSFQNHEYEVKENDRFYLFSDGYSDQFGGPKGKKFMSGRFKKLITESHALTLSEQQQKLENEFEIWKGDYDQIDDVSVIGFSIN